MSENPQSTDPSDEQKAGIKGLFKEALGEFIDEQRAKEEAEEDKEHTKRPKSASSGTGSWYTTLFGG